LLPRIGSLLLEPILLIHAPRGLRIQTSQMVDREGRAVFPRVWVQKRKRCFLRKRKGGFVENARGERSSS